MQSTDDHVVLKRAIDEAISRKPEGHAFIIAVTTIGQPFLAT